MQCGLACTTVAILLVLGEALMRSPLSLERFVRKSSSCNPAELIAADMASIAPYCSAAPVAQQSQPPSAQTAGLRLTQVQVLVRHSIRAPLFESDGLCCTLSHDAQQELANVEHILKLPTTRWNPATRLTSELQEVCRDGELTEHGFWHMRENGRKLKDTYGDFLGNLSSEELYIRSTATSRSYGSVVALLTGIFGNGATDAVERPFNLQFSPDGHPEALLGQFCNKTSGIPSFLFTEEGAKETLLKADVLFNNICNGVAVPSDVERDELRQLKEEVDAKWCYPDSFARVASHPIMTEVLSHMQQKRDGTQSAPRAVLLSGHDISIAPVLAALNISNCEWVPLASSLAFELWGSETRSAVRVLYNGELVTPRIPGCGDSGFCELETLERTVGELLGRLSFDEACDSL